MIRRLSLGLVLSLSMGHSWSQLAITHATLETEMFAPRTFLSLSISNPGGQTSAQISGEVLTSNNELVLTFRSASFDVRKGVHQVNSSGLDFTEFSFAQTPLSRSASLERRLPVGGYVLCLVLHPKEGSEPIDEFCEEFESEDRLFMDLVYPVDSDTIDEVRPTLAWTISSSKIPFGQKARLLLVPLTGEGDAYHAMAGARPVFVVDALDRLIVPYPNGVPDLERGRSYAWQVERFRDGVLIDRTEAWRFHVRPDGPIEVDRYVLLGAHTTNATVDVVDDSVFIRIPDNNGRAISCRVFLWNGDMLDTRSNALRNEIPAINPTGNDLFEIDLSGCGLKNGEYGLEVRVDAEPIHLLRIRVGL
jgi:hypothetical protein